LGETLLLRNSVWLWIAALALGSTLSTAAPAGASVRTATFTWTPASGPVWGYQISLSVDGGAESVYGYVYQPRAVILLHSAAPVTVAVAAFDAAGHTGPRSDSSPPLRLCPGDFDGDEIIEFSDLKSAYACILQAATGACAAADLDDDGSVSVADFTALHLGADACPNTAPSASCRGDMDGDGWISTGDVQAMRICIGLLAVGNCTFADFDGNGFVSVSDVVLASRAVGVCSN